MTDNEWEFTPEELRIAARVAKACGGLIIPAAGVAWELRADALERLLIIDSLHPEPI